MKDNRSWFGGSLLRDVHAAVTIQCSIYFVNPDAFIVRHIDEARAKEQRPTLRERREAISDSKSCIVLTCPCPIDVEPREHAIPTSLSILPVYRTH